MGGDVQIGKFKNQRVSLLKPSYVRKWITSLKHISTASFWGDFYHLVNKNDR